MENKFGGHIRPKKELAFGNDCILQPVYVVSLEVFRRGLLTRPEYKHYQAVVDAGTGKVEFFPSGSIHVISGLPFDGKTLPVLIGTTEAEALAEMAARQPGKGGWKSFLSSIHVFAATQKTISTWRIWIASGDKLIDSVTEKEINVGVFLAQFLSGESNCLPLEENKNLYFDDRAPDDG